MNRDESLARLRDDGPFDFLIVGGGATGLGAAVDAASRGHKVALVEAHDFAKGTSSRSTKLVHGGVRYLKQGNVSLVVEALRERGRLAKNAPHLVHDLAFVIPTYKWWDGPFYGIGLKVYDTLAGKLGLGPSHVLDREETLARIPTVETDGLLGGVLYHDGQFDDSRLAIDLARTAERHGGVVVNYVRAVSLVKRNGLVAGAVLRDEERGEEFEVHAKAVVNATGVFVDALRQADDKDAKPIVAVSQGVHLVLPKRFLPGDSAIMVPKTSDGRVLFAVPWHDRVVVGTTDTPMPDADIEPRALEEERAFLMEHACRYLHEDPTPDDVLSIFAGLRPLVRHGDSSDTSALSRDHTILVSESGLLTVTGGKWTTYRKMGEDVVDQAEMIAGVDGKPCVTADLPIQTEEADTTGEPLHPSLPLRSSEIGHFAKNEMARTVEDVLARRSRCLLLDAKASMEIADRVAALLAESLGRDDAWAAGQARAYRELAAGYVF